MLAEVYTIYALPLARAIRGGFSLSAGGGRTHIAGVTSPFELDDLVQETFLRLLAPKSRLAYDGEQPFMRYATAVARNLVIDRGRRLARRGEQLISEEGRDEIEQRRPASPTGAQEEEVLAQELSRLYQTFLASIGERERQLWLLRVEQRQPRRVVEEATGLSAMQVRTREQQLRRQLLRQLEGAGYDMTRAIAAVQLVVGVLL